MLISPTYGNITFDAVFRLDHRAEVVVTEHPVQSGAKIADHAYVEPLSLSMEIGMSDAVSGGAAGRSQTAFQLFLDLLKRREPLRIVTRLNCYDNMIVTSLSAPDDKSTMNALRAVVTLKEVITARTQAVTLSSATVRTVAAQAITQAERLLKRQILGG